VDFIFDLLYFMVHMNKLFLLSIIPFNFTLFLKLLDNMFYLYFHIISSTTWNMKNKTLHTMPISTFVFFENYFLFLSLLAFDLMFFAHFYSKKKSFTIPIWYIAK